MANVLITGCRGGIGYGVATRLLQRGHFVYATVHYEESIQPLRSRLHPFSPRVLVDRLDITRAEDRKKTEKWDIDVLINNAAVGDSGPLVEIPTERVRAVFETNLYGTLALTQIVAERMARSGGGRLVFVGSMAGQIPTPFLAPYAMTKFALESVAYSLRSELRPFGVHVVMINPGAFDTGFNQKNIAKKYDWLTSESLYNRKMALIRRVERIHLRTQLKTTASIERQIVKAVEAKKPKRRYIAPRWQWLGLPFVRHFG